MIKYFDYLWSDIKSHALREYPNECCGIIHNNKYISLVNEHPNTKDAFLIRPETLFDFEKNGDIQAIVHSHINYPHASEQDQTQQTMLDIPFGIVNCISNNIAQDPFWFGDTLPIQDLISRPFIQGVYDCLSVVRDYFRLQEIIIPNVSREFEFWKKNIKLVENSLSKYSFHPIDFKEAKRNDVLIYSGHVAVIVNETEVLHHYVNKLSTTYPIHYRQQFVKGVMRIND